MFRQIAEYLATRSDAIYKVLKTRVESTPEGPNIYMEVSIVFGFNILTALREFKDKIRKEIEKLTTMNVKRYYNCSKSYLYAREKKEKRGGINMSFIVAIDGPAGTGKGTITKLISKKS